MSGSGAGRVAAGLVGLTLGVLGGCAASGPSGRSSPRGGDGGFRPMALGNGSTVLYGSTRVVEPGRSDLGSMEPGMEPGVSPRTPARGAGSTLAVGIDAAGQVVTSNDFRGKVVVLDFWATWCGPCKASSGAFQALSDRFAGDGRVMTLAIHTDHTGDPKGYMREHGYTFRMVPRGQEFAAVYAVNVLPTFIVLDERGRVIYRDTGMMGEAERLRVEGLVRERLR